MNEANIGDVVLLQLGVDYTSAPKGLKRWDGCQFEVCKKKMINGKGLYYELKSCKSAEGINYCIHPDWIARLR